MTDFREAWRQATASPRLDPTGIVTAGQIWDFARENVPLMLAELERLRQQEAALRDVKDAAWAFKLAVYSFPGTAPNGNGRLIDWMESQSEVIRDATPDLQLRRAHQRLLDAVAAADALITQATPAKVAP